MNAAHGMYVNMVRASTPREVIAAHATEVTRRTVTAVPVVVCLNYFHCSLPGKC